MGDRVPTNPEAFDVLRHDRTRQYLRDIPNFQLYQSAEVLVVVHPDVAGTFAGQLLTFLTVNLLVRWCRNVKIQSPDASLAAELQRQGSTTLLNRMAEEAKSADPWTDLFSEPEKPYVIHVGGACPGARDPDLIVGSSGWAALASRHDNGVIKPDRSKNPCGPALAACIACAEALKFAVGLPDELRARDVAISLFDYSTDGLIVRPEPPAVARIGNALMVGAGSVGSNLAYLLSTLQLDGNLSIVDHDIVNVHNLDRSALFGVQHLGRNKAEIAAEWLHDTLPAQSFPVSYNEYVRTVSREPNQIDLVFPLANEHQVRWAIANAIPPLSIHGTTRPDWGANLGRHIPLREPCLGCRFGVEQEPVLACSTGDISSSDGPAESSDAALPFLSMAAATFALAEMLKTNMAGYPFNRAFVDVDFKGPMTTLAHHDRAYRAGCACEAVDEDIYRRFNGETRFSAYSIPVRPQPGAKGALSTSPGQGQH